MRMLQRRWRYLLGVGTAVAAGAAFVLAMGSGAFAATLFSDNFEDGNSTGWTTSGGTWSVGTDGSLAFRQSATTLDARALAGSSSWTDYLVQARVKPTAFNGTNRFVAVLARAQSATSYYYVAVRSNNTVELKKLTNGTGTTLRSAALTVSINTWYTVGLEVNGSTLRAFVNGTLVATATDTAYAAGTAGLATFYATASFDDVVVSSLAPPSPSPSASTSSSPPPSGPMLVVATNGNDANPGTLASPLRTIQRAVDLAAAGTTIAIRGGTYAPSTNIQINKNGTSSAPFTMTAFNGERVIIDGEQMPHTPAPLNASIPRAERGALHVEGDWWRFVGLEIINGPYAIFGVDVNNDVFDRLIVRNNYESGLHIQGSSSNNQILNLDSSGNRDPRKNGESADGLAIKEGSGSGNLVRGARLWNNSDDGFDAWEFLTPIRVENSVAWGNGFNRWGFSNFTGDGNGFKMGGGDVDPPANHTVRNSIAFDNAVGGFIDNGNPGSLTVDRNTAYRNGGTGFDFADSTSTLTKNLSVRNATAVSLGSSTASGNSWNLGGTWDDSSLLSTDPSVITGPRDANGNIRHSDFLVPRNNVDIGART
jgi:hypothetical protein